MKWVPVARLGPILRQHRAATPRKLFRRLLGPRDPMENPKIPKIPERLVSNRTAELHLSFGSSIGHAKRNPKRNASLVAELGKSRSVVGRSVSPVLTGRRPSKDGIAGGNGVIENIGLLTCVISIGFSNFLVFP